jgi:hypothetical protein
LKKKKDNRLKEDGVWWGGKMCFLKFFEVKKCDSFFILWISSIDFIFFLIN